MAALRRIAVSACTSEQQPDIARRVIAEALAAGPWHESLVVACQIEPALLASLDAVPNE